MTILQLFSFAPKPSKQRSIGCGIYKVRLSRGSLRIFSCPTFRICYTLGALAGPVKTPSVCRNIRPGSQLQRGGTVKNIFVGNLSFNTSEDELRKIFEPYGTVDRVSILTDRETGRSRGFGFVEMANGEEGDKAIAGLNGSQVGGRTINVNEARPKAERASGGGRGEGGGRR
jgi:cold-inducible RNA-binding protein